MALMAPFLFSGTGRIGGSAEERSGREGDDSGGIWIVESSAWFRDHWYHEHQQLDDMADSLQALEAEQDIAGFLPDAIDDDIFSQIYASTAQAAQPPVPLKSDAVLKALVSPKGGDAHKGFPEKPRYTEKATKYAGSPRSPRGGATPRFIHQPR